MKALRVLVVENHDERRLADVISNAAATELTAVAETGRQAISLAQRLQPDAILMASNVTGIDAFVATREIMTVAPMPIVVVVDERGAGAEHARMRLQAAGALAAVPFPARTAELTDLMLAMAAVGVVRRRPERTPAAARPPRSSARVIAIGASTGGPAALRTIFMSMPADLKVPILVTQHISSGFTDGMLTWWNSAGPLRAKIAQDGEPLCSGTIYVAPDDRHLTITPEFSVATSAAPAVGGHRPSAGVMFSSAAQRYGPGALAVILTGMGRDGVEGLADVHRAGGSVCAQDETTCAVFGMPKAAIEAGVVDHILPLDSISRHIARAVASS